MTAAHHMPMRSCLPPATKYHFLSCPPTLLRKFCMAPHPMKSSSTKTFFTQGEMSSTPPSFKRSNPHPLPLTPPPPSIGAPIAFIGLIQPSSGGLLPMAEMQSRWACEIFSRRLSLPSPSSMIAQMQSDAAAVHKRFYGSARHSVQRDTFPYNDRLAAAMGCKPALFSMDIRLMCRLWLGTVVACMWKWSAHSADTSTGNTQSVEAAGPACVEWSRCAVNFDV
jgi:hypothetical protein